MNTNSHPAGKDEASESRDFRGARAPARTNVGRRMLRRLEQLVITNTAASMTQAWSDLAGPIDPVGSDHERIRRAARAIEYAMQDARPLRVRVEALPALDPAMRDAPLDAIDTLLINSLANISNQWSSVAAYLGKDVVMAARFWAKDLPDDELDLEASDLGAFGQSVEELLDQITASTELDEGARERLQLVIRALRDVVVAARIGGQYAFSAAVAAWEGIVRSVYPYGVQPAEQPILTRVIAWMRTAADDIDRVKNTMEVAEKALPYGALLLAALPGG